MTGIAKNKKKTGLVLQGGGARGAYQIGVLKAVGEITTPRKSPFSIISGASVGAINAAPLAASTCDFQRGVHHLEKLWRGLHCEDVYQTHATAIAATSLRWLWSIVFGALGVAGPCSLLNNSPLQTLLDRETKWHHLRRAIRRGNLDAFCITASSYRDGQAVTWFMGRDDITAWERAKRVGIRAEIGTEHLMASSALPFVFPAVKIAGHYYGDGSLRLTSPFSAPIRMGAERLFIISVRDVKVGPQEGKEANYPSIGEMAGHALDIMFNDNLDADHERLCRINDTLSRMSEAARKAMSLRRIETLMISPSRDLRDVAAEHAKEMPRSIRLLLRSLGSWGKDDRLTSYLLFEPGYTGALIDLGYQDAMGQKADILSFLQS